MQRFKPFLSRSLDQAALQSALEQGEHGVRGRWVPDEIEEFDEVEVALPLDDERDLTVSLALEQGLLARLLFGWVEKGDEDGDPRALSEDALAAALQSVGERAVALLSRIMKDAE